MDIDGDEPEHVLCRRWREDVLELSRPQMATLTGYSAASIKDFEKAGRDIDEKARKRYRLAVAAASFGVEFDWQDAYLRTRVPVEMTIRRPRR